MRTALWGVVIAGSTLAGWLSLGAGCGVLPGECAELFNCPPDGSGGAGSSSGIGGDSGPPPQCVPTAGQAPVSESCGVFVSSSLGDDVTALGTKAKPYKTLAAAVLAADMRKAPVYACAETFLETVNVTVPVGIFGGLDCTTAGWPYTGDVKSTLTAGPGLVPLTLSSSASSVDLVDFKVQAADAVAEGGSSIAVIADAVTASFTRCDLIAGNGVKGADGVMLGESPGPSVTTDPAIAGNKGAEACSAPTVNGGGPKVNTLCMMMADNPIGGGGGTGHDTFGGGGDVALANDQTAKGGIGQPPSGGWGCIPGFGQAGGGVNGEPGMDGAGAAGMAGLGQLTLAGYVGASGLPGGNGKPGQGGGGGGAAKGKSNCGGASGGGGGTGGCGGLGGTGGKAGGASIGLVSLGATLSFTKVSIALGIGGAGGSGGEGHNGKPGGVGGAGGGGSFNTYGGCRGGDGGQGGFGGKGGGGRGGHVIGIAASGGTVPDAKGIMLTQPGTPGAAGIGGGTAADPGVKAVVQMFL